MRQPQASAPAAVRASFWYKGTGACTGFVRFLPAPGVTLATGEFYDTQHFAVPMPKDEWTRFSFDAKTPAAALEAGLVVMDVTIYQRGEGTLWLDDVTVEGLEQ